MRESIVRNQEYVASTLHGTTFTHMQDFKKLKVWKKGIEIAKETYKLTDTLPSYERFGLTQQMNRSSVSISSNIAEGTSRRGRKEIAYFIRIALGSSFELETQLILSRELGLVEPAKLTSILGLLDEEQKMLQGLLKRYQHFPDPRV